MGLQALSINPGTTTCWKPRTEASSVLKACAWLPSMKGPKAGKGNGMFLAGLGTHCLQCLDVVYMALHCVTVAQ